MYQAGTRDNKELYRELCKTESNIPIFCQDWWLDAVCGEDEWDVAIVQKGDHIVASLPYYMWNHYGMKMITMPKLTQTMGPWIRGTNAKYAKRLSREKDLMTQLIKNISPFDYFSQNFHFSITNWLPFYWLGFEQTTRYTYVIEDLIDQEKIWGSLLEKIRTDIKKGKDRFQLKIRTDLGIDKFLENSELTFRRQGKKLPYSVDLVKRLDAACERKKAMKIFFAIDQEERIHAATYIIWDKNSAYYLMGGANPELRNSGATSLCLFEAIKFTSTVTKRFDFEGSMVESVERFFRAFGAKQIPYFRIWKDDRPPIRKAIIEGVRKFRGALKRN